MKLFLFDLYGTLILTNNFDISKRAWEDSFLHFITQKQPLFKPEVDFFKEFWRVERPVVRDDFTLFESRLITFMDNINAKYSMDEIPTLADFICCEWQKPLAMDSDVIPMLNKIKKDGHKVGLVSNFDHGRHVRTLLEDYEIDQLFDVIIISEEVRVKKPDPKIFDFAINNFESDFEDIYYIGDSIIDYEASKSKGLKSIIIRRESQGEIEILSREMARNFVDSDLYLYQLAQTGAIRMISSLKEVY